MTYIPPIEFPEFPVPVNPTITTFTTSNISIVGVTTTFPTELTLLNQKWRVEYKTPVVAADGTEVVGLCVMDQRLILIDSAQAHDAMLTTLVHEVGHAYFTELPHSIKDKWEEAFAQLFAIAVIDLFRGNKQFSLY